MFTREKCIRTLKLAAVTAIFGSTLGCPPIVTPQSDYDVGFDVGFLRDDWYWQGYADSYDTIDFGPLYYQGSDIPSYTTPEYDAGYWDGVWYAYNDGYFTDYRYAFIIGFSEGYDNAFWPDYLDFLAADQHTEFADGGWSDGYNDGYSEGRVFGANDYEQGLPFDWADALKDYESGTDLYFQEVNVGTGAYGPVTLYEYGTDPALKKSPLRGSNKTRFGAIGRDGVPAVREASPGLLLDALSKHHPRAAGVPAIRLQKNRATKVNLDTRELYRPLTATAQAELNVVPTQSLRDTINLRLTTTWLKRVTDYTAANGKAAHDTPRHRITAPRN